MEEGVEGAGAVVEKCELAQGRLVGHAGRVGREGEGVCLEMWGCRDGD